MAAAELFVPLPRRRQMSRDMIPRAADASPELLFLFGVLLLLHAPTCFLLAAFRCVAWAPEDDVAAFPRDGRQGLPRGSRLRQS